MFLYNGFQSSLLQMCCMWERFNHIKPGFFVYNYDFIATVCLRDLWQWIYHTLFRIKNLELIVESHREAKKEDELPLQNASIHNFSWNLQWKNILCLFFIIVWILTSLLTLSKMQKHFVTSTADIKIHPQTKFGDSMCDNVGDIACTSFFL